MTDRFAGIYFDGISGREHAVELRRVGASHYAVQGDGIERSGALDKIAITPASRAFRARSNSPTARGC